ncbi:MAG: ATP-dependent Clp protease proteolytic subunit 2 [Candidatus Yanofskybacteria bacterium GW2011_GWA1_41_6]|uniref:ATP-dependent Clp protease proteolytic subunit n=1 Tax=Candidatus Yanofskybacteria bacterium GW2011_GWA1_41_6 TaxID=1619020 RepID=A0A0G0WLT3_9BACT|nr:MAG: ATP-dependent Clp protease proteolytic subunit 2 [Candidatus Yanofskybacteria bacterium GW2011_GWA1_41_6]
MEFFANKGIFILGGDIDIDSFYGLLTGVLPVIYYKNKEPIWVFLNSCGGDILQGLAIHDILVAVAKHGIVVNILGMGVVASMAVCIMQAATKRFAFPNTQFTIHQASLTGDGGTQEVNELIENAKEVERVNEIVLKIIAERSGVDLEGLKSISKKTDYSIGADKAKEFGQHGLIDEVITTFPFPING